MHSPERLESKPLRPLIDYDDFAIHFEPDSARPDHYRTWLLPVTPENLSSSPFDGTAFNPGKHPLMARQFVNNLLEPFRDSRRRSPVEEDSVDLADFGGRLFDALFIGELGAAFAAARDRAEESGRGLRLRLVVDPARGEPALRLLALPWELLFDRQREQFLIQNPGTAIVRHLRNPAQSSFHPAGIEGSLRVLTIAPMPEGLEPLATDREALRLEEALARRSRLTFRSVHPATLAELRKAVRDFDPHVLHVSGHGEFESLSGGAVWFEGREGSAQKVSPDTLLDVLSGARSLRVAVLNICDSGRVPSSGSAGKTALAFLRAMPAVVAMQFPITDRAAIGFAGDFYDAIAAGDPLEAAVAEGRKAIRYELENLEGLIPSLYLRQEHGQLLRRIDYSDLKPLLRPQDLDQLTQRFVGRAFVFQKIVAFLENEEKRGYFVLQGDPGIGKTTLLAEWIRRNGALYHFNVRNESDTNRSRYFLGNLCAQLIVRYQLPYTSLPDYALTGPGFLKQLLEEVSEHGLTLGGRLLIAVDALDEVYEDETAGSGNLLHLPSRLPENVFFILTTRRPRKDDRAPRLGFEVRREDFDLDEGSAENREDICRYIEVQISSYAEIQDKRSTLEAWWQASGLDRGQFIDRLADLSEGNFRYLVHVLPEIVEGKYQNATIDRLPQGLLRYYEDHWSRIRDLSSESWQTRQLPILSALTVVERPLELELIRYLVEIDSAVEVLTVLLAWNSFLHVRPHGSGNIYLQTYRFYHASFIDFIGDRPEVDLMAVNRRIKERITEDFVRKDAPAAGVRDSRPHANTAPESRGPKVAAFARWLLGLLRHRR